jgi:hypothetical protein
LRFHLNETGVELTRNDSSSDDDVLEGSNVTLVCRAYSFSTPPKWAYYRMINDSKEELVFINETISSSPHLGIMKRNFE